jgi:hypothetical protein
VVTDCKPVELKEQFLVELTDPKSLIFVRLVTYFERSNIELFTTPLLRQPFCSCSALIVVPRSPLRLSVIVRRALLKQRLQSQLVHGMVR